MWMNRLLPNEGKIFPLDINKNEANRDDDYEDPSLDSK